MTQLTLVTSDTNSLARYEARCRAIADAHSIDEVKLIRDQAAALAAAAKIAHNKLALRQCLGIQARAQREWARRHDLQKNPGGRPSQNQCEDNTGFPTLAQMGVSFDQSAQWHKLA